jgi:hypothetical protein
VASYRPSASIKFWFTTEEAANNFYKHVRRAEINFLLVQGGTEAYCHYYCCALSGARLFPIQCLISEALYDDLTINFFMAEPAATPHG